MIVLQIIGGIVLAAIVIVIVIYLYCRIKFGKYLHSDIEVEPLTIHLNEALDPGWLARSEVQSVICQMESLGYEKSGSYLIYEKPEYSILLMFKNDNIAAAVYWHDFVGCWVDLVADIQNGLQYTVTNAPAGAEMNTRPEVKRYYLKGKLVADLDSKIEEVLKNDKGRLNSLSPESFRKIFEAAYKKDMAWKHRNGGISYKEFLDTADKEVLFKSSEKDKEEAFIQTKEAELDIWREAALQEYRELTGITETYFHEIDHSFLVIPFTSDARAFIRYLNDWGFVEDKNIESYSERFSAEKDMYMLFDKLNLLLSPGLRAKYTRDLDFPLKLKIYQMNKNMLLG